MPIEICNVLGSSCKPDWNGVGAVATAAATLVALWLPGHMQRKQDRKRDEQLKAVRQEVASVVDRVVAYHDVATRLIASNPLYHAEFAACERISEITRHLERVLGVLLGRPELTDGGVTAAAAAEPVAAALSQALSSPHGQGQLFWERARSVLESVNLAAKIAKSRNDGVRTSHGLSPSTAALKIRAKYEPIIEGCAAARQTGAEPPQPNFDDHTI